MCYVFFGLLLQCVGLFICIYVCVYGFFIYLFVIVLYYYNSKCIQEICCQFDQIVIVIIEILTMSFPENNQVIKRVQIPQHKIKRVSDYVFDFLDEIGAGYSSTVYKGKNLVTNAPVAIKVIQLSKIKNSIERMLLQNQSKALSTINHPNILRAAHIMQTTNNFYFITELFQQNLEQLIKKKGKFTQPEAIQFLFIMANSLSYLERQGIVHRDIKPSNIFLKNNEFVLGDFGFCQFSNKLSVQKGFNVGSPLYMSPESYRSSIYSSKSDLWSLGICAIELLLGEKPFGSLTYDQMIHSLCQLRYYRQFPISNQFKELLGRIFQIQPDNRISPCQLIQKMKNLIFLPACQPHSAIIKKKPQNRNQHKRSSSQTSSQQIQFKNFQKKKIAPKVLANQNQQNVCIAGNQSQKIICLTDRNQVKLKNPGAKQNGEISRMDIGENPKITVLQHLSKFLNSDARLHENTNKLKLARLLSILPCISIPSNLQSHLMKIPADDYFNYVLKSINSSNFGQISHYLAFLLQSVYSQYQCECASQHFQDANYIKRLNCLHHALSLWQPTRPIAANNNKISQVTVNNDGHLERNKSKSLGNLNNGLFLKKPETPRII